MNKKRILIIAVILLLLGCLLLLTRPKKQEVAVPTPTPSIDAYAADRPVVTQLSTELAERYQTFSRADAPEYLTGLKPYLTPSEFKRITDENLRYAGKVPFLMPVRSKVTSTDLNFDSNSKARATVTLSSTSMSDNQQFIQVLEIDWLKDGGTWRAERIGFTETR